MKKVGIITLNAYCNYGNRLQNYALQKYIKNLSKDIIPETIWYYDNGLKVKENQITKNNIRRYIFNRKGFRDLVNSVSIFMILYASIILKNLVMNISI